MYKKKKISHYICAKKLLEKIFLSCMCINLFIEFETLLHKPIL